MATEMSVHHVRKGLTYIREIAALANRMPLIWTRKGGHQLSPDLADLRAYIQIKVHALLTRNR